MTSSKSYRKNDSLIKNLEKATNKLLVKDYKTHQRHASMEIKYGGETKDKNEKNDKSKSPGQGINLTKNIHAMKELLFNTNINKTITKPTKPPTRQNASNIIVNQGGNPCFNHITIYTSNNNSSTTSIIPKPNDINLRQYIFNKVNKPKSLSKIGNSHARSASTHMN